jgi:hypothetical protein
MVNEADCNEGLLKFKFIFYCNRQQRLSNGYVQLKQNIVMVMFIMDTVIKCYY